jgi:hypothetical protein
MDGCFQTFEKTAEFHSKAQDHKSFSKEQSCFFDVPIQPAGNLAAQRLLRSGAIRPKLAVSQLGDIYEREAEHVADQIMRVPEPSLQRSCVACEAGATQCLTCKEKALIAHRKADHDGHAKSDSASASFVESLGSGRPLDPATRVFFESRFGADLRDVRVHTDARAAESARSINALAYTTGHNIVFASERFHPGSSAGRKLLAHELAHIIQQDSLSPKTLSPNDKHNPADGLITEAAETASPVLSGSNLRLARQTADGSASGTPPVTASPQELMDQGNALRMQFLHRAALRVRQLQIACEKQSDPFLLIQALPEEVRAFVAWLGVTPWEDSFCVLVDWVKRLIEQNMNMVVPPFLFAGAEDEFCKLNNEFALANFERTQIRICPRLVDPQTSSPTLRALILIHEMFHDPSFQMGHFGLEAMDSAHCGFMGSFEAASNPYCVTNVIGQLGGDATM